MSAAQKISPLLRFKAMWKVLRDRRTPGWSKALFIVLAGLYLLSPIDLIPEALLGPLGLADDLVVIPFLAWLATQAAPKFVRREAKDAVVKQQTQSA